MHNVNVEAVEQTAAKAEQDPRVMVQGLAFHGDWQTRLARLIEPRHPRDTFRRKPTVSLRAFATTRELRHLAKGVASLLGCAAGRLWRVALAGQNSG
jgi:uncharacterized protein (DUF1697 family)